MAAEVSVATTPPEKTGTGYLALFQWEGGPGPAVKAVDRATGGLLSRLAADERFEGKEGKRLEFPAPSGPAKRIAVFGLGKKRAGTAGLERLRRAGGQAALRARDSGSKDAALMAEGLGFSGADAARALAEGALLATYRFNRYRTEGKKEERPDPLITLLVASARRRGAEGALGRARAVAEAVSFARDLVNEPAGSLPPRKLAEAAARMAEERGLTCEVLDEKQIEKLGMEGLRAVSRGSEEPPRFIHVAYAPRGAKRKVALAGKGITFDSGGLDLKPADGMLRMKYDMAGAAAVLGTVLGLSLLKPKVEVHALVPTTENMPGGRAYKPGDIVRPLDGKTVEIGNTDAEGRVVLADALGYARRLAPDEVIDVATLTGAAAVAVGKLAAALFTDDERMARDLQAAAARAGEYVWRLPLYEEYQEQIKGDIADLKNVGDREGGAITAALFLKEFTRNRKWAHLDIAGAAFTEKDLPCCPKGGTGFAVRTLLEYLSPA